MQYTKKAKALKIAAISTVTSSLEVISLNISLFSITPEPTREVKHPGLTSLAVTPQEDFEAHPVDDR